jgi:hypothetical protein
LYQTEVRLGSGGKTIVTVEQDLGRGHEIDGRQGVWRTGISGTEVEPIVVCRTSQQVLLTLDNPDQFFNGVVKVQSEFVRRAVSKGYRFSTLVLSLIDEVFVRPNRKLLIKRILGSKDPRALPVISYTLPFGIFLLEHLMFRA